MEEENDYTEKRRELIDNIKNQMSERYSEDQITKSLFKDKIKDGFAYGIGFMAAIFILQIVLLIIGRVIA